ncbi:hypothetical protein DW657_00020 [Prevotella sp. AM23-5]|uniref:fimbrillin family protein n=1 Tax=Prevotellaceae TaxID=171552 RepID=UPI000E4AB59B|nr:MULTISPECIES: fimbrillin family protein [Prevotellaceae]RHN98817.1 hypothetical protein DW657_00020 [Prevotella sp. AM23-5]
MKKSVLLMAAATAIALSSCSSEDTKDVAKSSNITFRSTVGLNSRGTEATTDNLKNIWVSAWADNDVVFTKEQFAKKGAGTTFESVGGPWFWEKDKAYTFMAFATGKENMDGVTPTISKDNITLTDYTPNTNLADQLDLLVAKAEGTKAQNGTAGADLNFDHILSQIQIKVQNTNANLKYVIKGVRITNVQGTGTYTFKPGEAAKHNWQNQNFTTQYILHQGVNITLDENNKAVTDLLVGDNSAMLLPQTITSWDGRPIDMNGTDDYHQANGAYISLLINVQKKNGAGDWVQVYPKTDQVDETKCAWTAVAIPAVNWENGNKYIYTLNLSKGAGKVDPAEPGPDWTNKDPKPGDTILGEEIFFNVTVTQWVDQATNVPM